jgi:hypothetical protein
MFKIAFLTQNVLNHQLVVNIVYGVTEHSSLQGNPGQ